MARAGTTALGFLSVLATLRSAPAPVIASNEVKPFERDLPTYLPPIVSTARLDRA